MSTSRPARSSRAEVRAARLRRRSRRCPAGCPACRCRSTSPAVIWPYIIRPLRLELAEVLPGGPLADQVRVGDQHARRVGVRPEHAHRLARLHQQRLVVVERLRSVATMRRSSPVARGLAGAAVDDQVLRGARRPRGRGCSSACAARLPAPSPGSCAPFPGAHRITRPAIVSDLRQGATVGAVDSRTMDAPSTQARLAPGAEGGCAVLSPVPIFELAWVPPPTTRRVSTRAGASTRSRVGLGSGSARR